MNTHDEHHEDRPTTWDRRGFLAASIAAMGAMTMPAWSESLPPAPITPGVAGALNVPSNTLKPKALPKTLPYPLGGAIPAVLDLWMVKASTGEEYREAYSKNGVLLVPGYTRLCHALRDARADKAHQMVRMDIKLLNLMFAIQQWLKVNGQLRPIMITSGYRTQATNESLEGTAKNSMHGKAKACDFYVDGMPTKYLADLVAHFQEGGVGLYMDKHFVHADTGSLRQWVG